MRKLSLANVAVEVTAWRKTKQHRTSTLPKEIANHIRELAKFHKPHHIAEKLKMNATTVTKALQIDQPLKFLHLTQNKRRLLKFLKVIIQKKNYHCARSGNVLG